MKLLACIYSQIPEMDFLENYWPVVNDTIYWILILLTLIDGNKEKIVDVETVFLYRESDEEIYMECPHGLKINRDKISILGKCIYGLVQAVRQYYKKIVAILKKFGFTS